MNDTAQEVVLIDLELRFVLVDLQAALGATFPARECQRVFSDALADQVSPKEYHFHDSARVTFTGSVIRLQRANEPSRNV